MDRVLDRLNYLEAGPEGLPEMEPFLRVLVKFKSEVAGQPPEKLPAFFAANAIASERETEETASSRIAEQFDSTQLQKVVKSELEDMAQQDDVDLSSKAAEFGNS